MYVCIHYPRPCQCKLHVNAVVIPASRGTTGFIPAYARNLHAFDTDHYTISVTQPGNIVHTRIRGRQSSYVTMKLEKYQNATEWVQDKRNAWSFHIPLCALFAVTQEAFLLFGKWDPKEQSATKTSTARFYRKQKIIAPQARNEQTARSGKSQAQVHRRNRATFGVADGIQLQNTGGGCFGSSVSLWLHSE